MTSLGSLGTVGIGLVLGLIGQGQGIRQATAEDLLIRGMGRTVGWVVANAKGELHFRDCNGQFSAMRDGRVDRTSRRCPGADAPVTVTGRVSSFDPAAEVLVVEDGAGAAHGFFIGGLTDPSVLNGLAPEVRVEVSGPVAGHATALIRR
jgi:hypothetical protein